ncbi:MAG: hypothetical protein M3503_00310 [Actinomycetota bacterium]|nr:hypothetical protein [Actinomycetota bacterium]
MGDEVRSCAGCGEQATVPAGGLPADWSLASDRRGVVFHCGTCTRTNLRAIEGKLDEGWEEGG